MRTILNVTLALSFTDVQASSNLMYIYIKIDDFKIL